MKEMNFPLLICLIRGLNKVMEADVNRPAKILGLTLTELNFLWTIFHEKNPSISRLSKLTLLDPSTATQVVTRLKKKNLVVTYMLKTI